MPTPGERQALLFFAAVAALGVGVNAWRAVRGGDQVIAGSAADLAAQIARVDSAVAASPSRDAGRAALRKRNAEKAAKKRATEAAATGTPVPSTVHRPPSTVNPVDLDLAPAPAIESLPRLGPALARRIVANRDSFGPFGSMDGLQRVRGIGPSLAKALAPRVTFSGRPRPDAPTGKDKGRRRRSLP
ncbi:MAG: helix-hairpin-helix domain-containing protein [Gemmatimonadetes bacterium]|nr:helix-hairpin-helix domain-containing protein [Gemmatimonadota bacterium]